MLLAIPVDYRISVKDEIGTDSLFTDKTTL